MLKRLNRTAQVVAWNLLLFLLSWWLFGFQTFELLQAPDGASPGNKWRDFAEGKQESTHQGKRNGLTYTHTHVCVWNTKYHLHTHIDTLHTYIDNNNNTI